MPVFDLALYKEKAVYSEVNGHQVAHWHAGSGPNLLFLHGFPSASWDWYHQWLRLQADFHCHALDMLGFGFSDKPNPHQYSLLEQADIVETLLIQWKVKRCMVVAHDYGSSVAQELLSRQQQHKLSFRLEKLCWLNGGLFAESHRPLFAQKLLHSLLGPYLARGLGRGSLKRSMVKIFSPSTPPSEQEIDALWQLLSYKKGNLVLPQLLNYLDERPVHRDRWVEAMQQTRIPLKFINGVLDPISGQHMLDQFREIVPNGQYAALEVGHYPQLEAPGQVTNLLHQFFG